jgi:signal transduction histidine kinase/ligand-binding sensor domain-containing protein/ActR/RegA family two-component response regulator
MVFDILQSRDGFIWIATKDGLNRFDGYRFEVFTPDAFDPFAIANSQVKCLFEDSRGWIWVVLPGSVDIFVHSEGRFFHLTQRELPGFEGDATGSHSIAEHKDGSVWITDHGKLWKIEVPKGSIEKASKSGNPFPGLPCKAAKLGDGLVWCNSVLITHQHQIFAGTKDGIYRLDPATGQFALHGMKGKSVTFLGEDKLDRIWFLLLGVNKSLNPINEPDPQLAGKDLQGLWVWESPSPSFKKVSHLFDAVSTLDYNGDLWLLEGINLTRWKTDALLSGGVPEIEWTCNEPFIQSPELYFPCLSFDRSGTAWLGTSGFGVVKINPAKPKFNSYLPVVTQRIVVEDPQGNLFTVQDPGKLYLSGRFERSIPNPWFSKYPKDAGFWSFAFDDKGNCWSNPGNNVLYRIDSRTKESKSFPWKGYGLCFGKNKKLISISEEGLSVFDPAAEQSKLYPFDKPQKKVAGLSYSQYFYEDSKGVVWIFMFEGLISATPTEAGYRYKFFRNNPADRTSLSNNFVLCAAEDPLEPNRYLWVGTNSGGLNRLDLQTGKFKYYNKANGLPDNVVYGILSENTPPSGGAGGGIWLSTNKGLCRFHVREETTKNFTYADGLQDNEFNSSSYLKMKNGTLLFGGVNGLTVFHPDSLRFNEHIPQIRIVGMKINNKDNHFFSKPAAPNSGSQTIRLSYKENLVSFDFAALEFSNPPQNQYRYQLIQDHFFGNSADESWIDIGEKNTVQFANLPPGSYTFKVIGSNNDGRWSTEPAVQHFVISPPWWASWWAYLLYLAAVVSAGYFLYRYRLRRRLEQEETQRLREMDDFKNRFFTNITHEFRTPLTVILGNLELMRQEIGKSLSEGAISQFLISKISITRRNGENLLRLINQILDLGKLESSTLKVNYIQGDVLPYLRYISESLHSLANAQNVMLRVESSPDSYREKIVMDYDPERLLQIVYNLLSNAIKFTPSGGKVVLSAGMRDEGRGLMSGTGSSLIHHPSSLILTVTDTGVGIPPEDLPHIFDRFYQANNLEKAKSGGTGIGLALTRELVLAMGGEISVKSQVGIGTTFMVRLPITNKAAVSDGVTSSHAVTPNVALSFPKGTSTYSEAAQHDAEVPFGNDKATLANQILLVEDNPDVVEYLAACLTGQFHLDFAYNGRAGIAKALETIPDLIISDVMMPEKDGFEVCDTLKNDERTSHIPIVLLTAKADVESRIKGLRRGADAYLSKPFHQEELLVTLAKLLELRKKLQVRYSKLEDLSRVPGIRKSEIEASSSLIPHP